MSQPLPGPVPRILVIDDDLSLGQALTVLFEHAGYQAEHSASSASALARARELRPDLAVLDVCLGADSGLDLLPALKAAHPEMQVIVLTAVATADAMSVALRRGACSFACKSIDPPHLLELVAAGLRNGRGRGTP